MKTIVVVLFITYLVILILNRIKKNKAVTKATQELFDEIENSLGSDNLGRVKRKSVWVGMPESLLYYTHGSPDKKDNRETPGKISTTWFFNPIPNVRKNAKRKHKTLIYCTNGFVSSWDVLS